LKEGQWKLKHLLEAIAMNHGLMLFDGVEYVDPKDLLKDKDLDEFFELIVKFDEYGIHDFYVATEKPLFTFALNCPKCGRLTQIRMTKKVHPADFCNCTGKNPT
jgi:hypothetical protein